MVTRRIGQIAKCCSVVMVILATLSAFHVAWPHDWTHQVCVGCQVTDSPATGEPAAAPGRPVDTGYSLLLTAASPPVAKSICWTQAPLRAPPTTLYL